MSFVYIAEISLDLSLTVKMWTQAHLSPKLAQSRYCYEPPEITGSSPQQEASTPPRQISHME